MRGFLEKMGRKGYNQLSDLSAIRKFVAKLINERKRGDIDSGMSRDCGYLSKILMEIMQNSEVEERLTKLEGLLEKKGVHK